MAWQRKKISDDSNIGEPGPLPEDLVGLADDALADLSAALDPDACEALGYAGQGFVWVDDPPPPEPPAERVISALGFMQRLTPAERIGIRTLAKTDVAVEDYLDLVSKATLVDLDHPDTVNGLAFLVSKGRLTADRAAEIRAGDKP